MATETRPCQQCGTPVEKSTQHAKDRQYWTCGKRCTALMWLRERQDVPSWQRNRFRGQRESRICALCGQPTPARYLTEANHDKPWYCSGRCAQTSRRGRTMPWRHGEERPCPVCGTPVYVQPRDADAPRYCSPACARVGLRAPVTARPCASCGKEMRLRPCHAARKYCSRACSTQARFKNHIDREHNGKPVRRMSDGYIKLWQPDHPYANKGWVLEHRWLMEQHLGWLLGPHEEVDHINEQRDDNRLENLQVLDKGSHRRKTSEDRRRRAVQTRERLAEMERQVAELRAQLAALETEPTYQTQARWADRASADAVVLHPLDYETKA